ncbi:MAG: hypothetical protein ACP59X_12475 [Solidesulfovibrio sp. DCME]|uniref:hypothetical protein n=1 Tax=Solidesulfovibrio sp. DCME TaxID=3447380 RepID=UPI003D15167F
MDAVKDLALRLLEREPPPGPVMDPALYVAGSLPGLLAALAKPGGRADGPALGSLCLKYAHAYVHPDRIGQDVSLEAVTELAGQFVRRRGGCRSLAGRDGLRRLLLHHGFALQMLFDLPKTVHLLTALGAAASRVLAGEGFLGLDCGAGTGILLLGQYLLAGQLGVAAPSLWGIEHLPPVAARADDLLSALGVGRVLCGDATASAIYNNFPQGPVACLTNETLPSRGRRLYKEPFTAICQALFAALGDRLGDTAFVPEAVWAVDRAGEWLRLAPENAFAGDDGQGKPARLFAMADVELAGRRLPADRVGEPFADLLAPAWREVLGRRW